MPEKLTQLGPYRILGTLGRGGQATVYRARRSDEDRTVALKVALADREDRSHRLIREYRALGRLSHPNLVEVYEHGIQDDHLFFAMEFVPGRDLRSLIQERVGRPPDPDWVAEVIRMACSVCCALGAIHDSGLIHRDVKPANIRLRPDGQVKLLDFGLVTSEEGEPDLTRTGFFVGSAPYISPEQILERPVDPRSDLYSLGATLFHLLAGRLPFQAESPMATAMAALQQDAPDLREVAPGVPENLIRIVERLLAKRPIDRFPSSEDLLGALRGTPGASGRGPTVQLRASLVGRQSELALLHGALKRLEQGRGGTILLAGEPGIGKSRLLAEIIDQARLEQVNTLTGACLAGASEPFSALQPILSRLRSSLGRLGETSRRRVMGEAGPVLANLLPDFDGLLSSDPTLPPERLAALRRRLPELLTDLLLRCATAPLLVTLEDLHWADPASLEVVDRLIRRQAAGPEQPLLLLATVRPGELPTSEIWQELLSFLGAADAKAILDLSPLQPAHLSVLLAELLGRDRVPPKISDRLHRLSGGNPLLVLEMARLLNRTDLEPSLSEDETGEELLAGIDFSTATRGIGELWTGRVSPAARGPLVMLAVVGPETPFPLLRRVWSESEEGLLDLLAELLRGGLLEERFPGGRPVYAFAHELIREALLEEMALSERAEIHRAVGEAMAALGGPSEDWPAAEMARHFAAAGLLDRAAPLQATAGKRAMRVGRPREATEFFQAALEAMEQSDVWPPEGPAGVLLHLGEALEAQGRIPEAEEAFARARQEAATGGHELSEAQALGWLSTLASRQAKSERARELAREAQELFRRLGDLDGMVTAANTVAVTLAVEQRHDQALQAMQELLEMARELGKPLPLASALTNMGVVLTHVHRYEESGKYLVEGLAIRQEMGQPRLIAESHANLAILNRNQKNLEEAEEHFQLAFLNFERSQDPVGMAGIVAQRAEMRINGFQWGEALRDLRYSAELLEGLGVPGRAASAFCGLARGLILIGQWEAAARAYDRYRDLVIQTASYHPFRRIWIERVALELRRQCPEEVARLLDDPGYWTGLEPLPEDRQVLECWLEALALPPAGAAVLIRERRSLLLSEDLYPGLRALSWIGGQVLLAVDDPEAALDWISHPANIGSRDPMGRFAALSIRIQALHRLGRVEEAEALTVEVRGMVERITQGLEPEDRAAFLALPEIAGTVPSTP